MPHVQSPPCRKVYDTDGLLPISFGEIIPDSKQFASSATWISELNSGIPHRDDFYLYTTTVDGAFRLFTVMEDDPSWFQLAASGSTTDIAQVQATLRDRKPANDYPQPSQPFVAFAVDEAISSPLAGSRKARSKDEEAAGHDHVFWFDRRGKLFRSILRVSMRISRFYIAPPNEMLC
jgi:hypothetical protein